MKKRLLNYISKLTNAVNRIDEDQLNQLYVQFKEKLFDMKDIHILGNGGSSANAHHVVGDYIKTFALYKTNLKISCLSDNSCYVTAAANDLDYSEVYELLVGTRITPGDLLLIMSGSGNSMNLTKAALAAKRKGVKIASITGYSGGEIARLSDISIHVPIDDMEMAEDAQIIVMHCIKQRLCEMLEGKNGELLSATKYNKRVHEGLVA